MSNNKVYLSSIMNKYFRKVPKPSPKATKQPRTWPLGGNVKDISSLDYTKDKPNNNADSITEIETNNEVIDYLHCLPYCLQNCNYLLIYK